jgi:hypothetical protein
MFSLSFGFELMFYIALENESSGLSEAGLSRSIGYSCKVFLGLCLFISSSCCMIHAAASKGSFEYVFYRAVSRYFFSFVRLFPFLALLSFCLCFRLSFSLSIFCLRFFVHMFSVSLLPFCLLLFVLLFFVFRILCFPFSSCFIFPTFVINFLLHALTFQPLFFISVCLLTVVLIFFSVVYLFPFLVFLSFFLRLFLFFHSFFILSFFYSFKSQEFLF